MNAATTRSTLITLAITAALATFPLGTGAAQATPGAHVGGATTVGFNPQPDPPAISKHRGEAGIGNPNDRPGVSVGLGGPDTAPAQHN